MPFNFEQFDNEAFRNNEKAIKLIMQLFDQLVKDVANRAAVIKFMDKVFTFSSYPSLNKQVDKILSDLASQIIITIGKQTVQAWALANAKNDKLIDYLSEETGIRKSTLRKRYQFGVRNEKALAAFQNRKINGLNLSDRVWKLVGQSKQELELAIDMALVDGQPASKLATSVKKYLNEPDRLFRRVRDKRGVLHLSKNAKAYKPGQGVYRSSRKNAIRLTRTEVNMAYREADHQRWQTMDFVRGIEIRLSNNPNHCPLCRRLTGKYPKAFVFKGWHPQCRCYAISILITETEYNKYERSVLKGEQYKTARPITELPTGAVEWFNENKSRIKTGKSTPFFLKDNPVYFSDS